MNRQKKQKRNRGLILTRQGWQKLQNAKLEQEFKEKNSSRFTIEELSDRAGITPVTFRKVMSREVGVDKQTLMRLFTAFGLELDKIDYTKPSPDLVTQEGLKTPERIDWGEAVCEI
ncbi:helix-turn-helix domain-containing protein, partial [Aetokthonos hydrillicola]|uniref:helix-turn-helix domain-containing protein n=1 Tax=Aetokthonos hydrillicola TaxID=1550245 RepID=UPI001ABB8F2E